jgi:hypothetical protein
VCVFIGVFVRFFSKGLRVTGFQIEDDAEDRRFLLDNAKNWDYIDDSLKSPAREAIVIKFHAGFSDGGFPTIRIILRGGR